MPLGRSGLLTYAARSCAIDLGFIFDLSAAAAGTGGKQMAELVALGVEVTLALGDRRGDDRHLVDDGEVVTIIDERVGLLGIVGEKANLGQSQVFEDLQADAVVAEVGPVAQGDVSLNRVQSLVLKVVGADLLDQADAPAFLG